MLKAGKSEDITAIERAKLVLMDLADDIGMTARKHDKKGRTVHITLK
jgi:DNA polymerase IV